MKGSLKELNKIPNTELDKSPQKGTPMFQPPLTVEQIEAAKAEPLNYVQNYIDIKAPHFVFYVQDQVTKMCAAGLFKSPGDIPCDKVVTQGGQIGRASCRERV